jgi:hypothetical protein
MDDVKGSSANLVPNVGYGGAATGGGDMEAFYDEVCHIEKRGD